MYKRIFCVLIAFAIFFSQQKVIYACPVWAATGDKAEGGGTLVGKTLDFPLPAWAVYKFYRPANGYKILAFLDYLSKPGHERKPGFYQEKMPAITAGINEKGLLVVSTAPANVPKELRQVGLPHYNTDILLSYDSVDAVLARKSMFASYRRLFSSLPTGQGPQ